MRHVPDFHRRGFFLGPSRDPLPRCYVEGMRRLPMFWQMFLAYAALVVTSLGLLGSAVVIWVEQRMLQQVEQELLATAVLLRETVHGRPIEGGRLMVLRDQLSSHITLLGSDGRVLLD